MKIYHVIGWGLLTAAACLLPSTVRADSPVLATVGGTPITAAEIEQALRLPLYDLEVEKYRLTQRKLDQTIVERLNAGRPCRPSSRRRSRPGSRRSRQRRSPRALGLTGPSCLRTRSRPGKRRGALWSASARGERSRNWSSGYPARPK